MKRIAWITPALIIALCATVGQAQAPTGQLISGATTGNVVKPIQVDANGVVQTSASIPAGSKIQICNSDGSICMSPTASGPVTPNNANGVVASYEALTSGGITVAMTATTSTLVGGLTGTSGKYYYITDLSVSNSHATQGTDVLIQDGSGGTAIWLCPAAPAYGGCMQHFNPPLKVPTQGNGIYAANVTTGANTKVFINAFQSTNSY